MLVGGDRLSISSFCAVQKNRQFTLKSVGDIALYVLLKDSLMN